MKTFSIIVAMDEERGIGKNGTLPWHLPADLKHFKEITTRVSIPGRTNAVIMGRKTWESLPEKFRPLPDRINAVLASPQNAPKDVLVFNSFSQALQVLETDEKVGEIFVIGGAQVYAQIVDHPQCARLYVTSIQDKFPCDAFFPAIPKRFKEIDRSVPLSQNSLSYCFLVYSV